MTASDRLLLAFALSGESCMHKQARVRLSQRIMSMPMDLLRRLSPNAARTRESGVSSILMGKQEPIMLDNDQYVSYIAKHDLRGPKRQPAYRNSKGGLVPGTYDPLAIKKPNSVLRRLEEKRRVIQNYKDFWEVDPSYFNKS